LVTATQLLQVPVHGVVQQTPSTQCLDVQALSLVPQVAPRGRLSTHLLLTHVAVAKQSAEVDVQEVLHALPVVLHL
jgi:hypothetical protein